MDQNSWIWRKKSTEKTLVSDKQKSRNDDEVTETLLTEKADLEKEIRILNDKLSSALAECNAKDEFTKKQTKIGQEAIAGWDKAETEAIFMKQELEKVLQQKAAAEERLSHLDAALKECMQQLRFVREEQESRIHEAVVKASEEFEKTRIVLDEKLAEAGVRLAKLDSENTQLMRALLGKDKVIEDLNKHRSQVETDFNALMSRVESTEKEKASLKYEVRVLEKELDIRNEEREFNHRTADVAHKQHLESAKKIAKLESECQRLRLLVRQRLPGPAAVAKMKNEVDMLGRNRLETRRRKSNPSLAGSMDFSVDTSPETLSRRTMSPTERLHAIEEENRILKEALKKKSNELQFSKTAYARMASRLSQFGEQLEESSKGQTTAELGKHMHFAQELTLASMSDLDSDEKTSCAESWASALMSEMEHFKNEKKMGTPSRIAVGTSDTNLMDDFAEMEKLTVVSVDYPAGGSHHSSEESNVISGPSGSPSDGNSSTGPGRKMVPVYDGKLDLLVSSRKMQSDNVAGHKVPGWLGDVLKQILLQSHETQRNPDEVLQDVKIALAHINDLDLTTLNNKESTDPEALCSPEVGGCIFQKLPSQSSSIEVPDRGSGNNVSNTKKDAQKFHSGVRVSLCNIIKLVEGINISTLANSKAGSFWGKDDKLLPYKDLETPSGYMVRVFQWKTSELSAILQQFVQTCNDLLNGKTELEQFAEQVATNLEWIMNHCFSLQDVSSMKDAIRYHFDCYESRSESEVDNGLINYCAESNKMFLRREEMPYPSTVSPLSGCKSSCQVEGLHLNLKEECRRLTVELANRESSIADLERRLQLENVKSESFLIQLRETRDMIESLQSEMETMKESKAKTEDQVEKHKMMKEDLESQLEEANLELNKACQKISFLENELEKKNNSSKRLEATCHELQIQLKSMTRKEDPEDGKQREKQLQNNREIMAASKKLAECEETILNLGKQLEALASIKDAAPSDKVNSTPADTSMPTPKRRINQRESLLDKMLAEDNAQTGNDKFPEMKEAVRDGTNCSVVGTDETTDSLVQLTNSHGINNEKDKSSVGTLAMVPLNKKQSVSLFKKLFWRKRKGNSKKI
ncbi:filament-like plant protein 7 isoform X3 [Olea europaea var. sylvestris]|nr:filament-like plant protein 7 isoform X3 [Olea europaea var. sylvestris]